MKTGTVAALTFTDANMLTLFYEHIDIFLLVLVRLFGFIVIIPVLSGANVPTVIKVGLSFFIAVVVVSCGVPGPVEYNANVFGYCAVMLKEFIVGLIAAFSVYMVFSVFHFIGQLIDFQIGFSMVSVFDPSSQIQVPITGNLFYLIVVLFFIQSGGLHSVIYTIAKSFEIVPLGQGNILGNADMPRYFLELTSNFFAFGLKMSLPIVGTILIVDIALGLLTKAIPQMNVFVIGMPMKLLVGLSALYILIPAFYRIYEYAYGDAVKYMMNMIRGMVP